MVLVEIHPTDTIFYFPANNIIAATIHSGITEQAFPRRLNKQTINQEGSS